MFVELLGRVVFGINDHRKHTELRSRASFHPISQKHTT
jgi:hypothetical protein